MAPKGVSYLGLVFANVLLIMLCMKGWGLPKIYSTRKCSIIIAGQRSTMCRFLRLDARLSKASL